jgi:hypothetical protein
MNLVHPSAGVYTSETDLSQRIRAVSSSIGAIVGAAQKGPVGQRIEVYDDVDYKAVFGNPNAKRYGFMSYSAVQFLQSSTRLFVTRLVNGALTAGGFVTVDDPAAPQPLLSINNFDDGANNPLGRNDPMNTIGFNPGDNDIANNLFMVCAIDPGEWNRTISVRVRPSNPRGRPVGSDHNILHFYVDVFLDYTGPNNNPKETFLVSRDMSEIGSDGQAMFLEDVINSRSKYIRVKNNPYAAYLPIWNSAIFQMGGGTDGNPITADQVAEAWELYNDPENIDVNILINAGYANPTVQRSMVKVARDRFDAFAILDIPFDKVAPADAVAYRRNTLNINDSYGALYAPWCEIRDTFNNKKLWVPPSGLVAAAYASTDSDYALWFAPAGMKRGLMAVTGLNFKYKQGARDALDQAQINPIRKIEGRGYVIWGALTLQSNPSSLSHIPVRRLFNFMKKSIATSIAFGVFDPNDVFLRRQLTSITESFLKPIKEGRGLYDFSVVCDERNNTNETIAAGDLNLDVIADPVLYVKRINLTSILQPTGATFSES